MPAKVLICESGRHGGGSFTALAQLCLGLGKDRERFAPQACLCTPQALGAGRRADLVAAGAPVQGISHPLHSRDHPATGARLARRLARRLEHLAGKLPGIWAMPLLRTAQAPAVRDLVRLARAEGAQLLVANNQPDRDLYVYWAARTLGLPCVGFLRSMSGSAFTPAKARLANAACAAFVANAHTTARYWTERGLDAAKVHVIHNAVDPAPTPPLDLHRELGAPEHGLCVGCVGRLRRLKGQDLLLEAFARLVAARPDALLVLVGDGPLEPELRRRTAELGLADRVVFAGYRPDARAVMAACDVVALPSRHEAFGWVLAEAMAEGAAVVGLEAGGIPEVVTHGVTGLLTPPEDVEALGAALVKLATDEALRRDLAQAGRAAVLGRFSPDIHLGEVARVLTRVLTETRHEASDGQSRLDSGLHGS